MITIFQEREIKNFLQKKNLSTVILNEVHDHFIIQISELMKDNVSFQEAFLKTKLKWQYELEMVKADFFSFKKIARIEKSVLQSRFKNITLYSIITVAAAFILSLIQPDFLLIVVFALSGIAFYLMLYNLMFKKMNFREYIHLQFHPLIIRNQLLALLFFSISYVFNGNLYFWEPVSNQFFIVFSLVIQIQLLYLTSKKVNILLA